MYKHIELLPKNILDKYIFTFIIPIFSSLCLILWFEILNVFVFFILGVIFLMGEFYFIKKVDIHNRDGLFMRDIVTVIFLTSLLLVVFKLV